MAERLQGSSRISQLDGLRSLAILSVLGLHFLNDSAHGAFGSFSTASDVPFDLVGQVLIFLCSLGLFDRRNPSRCDRGRTIISEFSIPDAFTASFSAKPRPLSFLKYCASLPEFLSA